MTRSFTTPDRPRAEARLAAQRIWVGSEDRIELVVGASCYHLTLAEAERLASLIDVALHGDQED